MSQLTKLLSFAVKKRVSDIHFSSEEPIRFRMDGDLVAIDANPINSENLQNLLFELLTPEEQSKLFKEKNLDKSYALPGVGQFRVNIFFNRKGIAAVLRSIPVQIPSFDSLGLPEVIRKVAEKPRGLILVTGPTGSGKSTTLAAVIDYINSSFPYHILTVEDPVEFIHPSKKSLINQRDIGHSCHSFQDALKYALREDPDVILIGELRDLETISLALTAAETGHLVLGTLHTRGAAASIDRMIDSFPSGQQSMIRAMIADSLLAVISQSLLKKANGSGRVAAYEIMVVNNAISNLIREGKVFQMEGVIQTGKKDGMVLMEQSLMALISQGVITAEEAAPYLKNPPPVTSSSNLKPTSPPVSKPKLTPVVPPPKPQAIQPAPENLEANWQIQESELIDFSVPSEEGTSANVLDLPSDEDDSLSSVSVELTDVSQPAPKVGVTPPPLNKKAG
jgi:twitching motility protein PilT